MPLGLLKVGRAASPVCARPTTSIGTPTDTAQSQSSPSSLEKPEVEMKVKSKKPSVTKDRLGEELGPDARIWRDYENVMNDVDNKLFTQWDKELDNLALFATLFSAVTTAFVLEGQKDMKEDYAKQAVFALSALSFDQPFTRPDVRPFIIPTRVRAMICLWIASLLLSLAAAFIAVMGKDWISMYRLRPVCRPRQWAEIRTYRIRYVEQWRLSFVIGSAPVLLHISLILFGAGLVLFFSEDPFTHRLTLGLSAATGSLYLFTGLTAVIFAPSPYKSPETQSVRWLFASFWKLLCRIFGSNDTAPPPAEPAPAQTTLRKLAGFFFSTIWTKSDNDKPVYQLIAEALSRLRDATFDPETVDSIIHALGDIHIAPMLANYVSRTLKNPIQTLIEGRWRQEELSTLSRYVLALYNLGWDDVLRHQIYSEFVVRSTSADLPKRKRSEDILVALFLSSNKFKDILPESVQALCPSVINHRTMDFLVSRLAEPRHGEPSRINIPDWNVATWLDTNCEWVIVLMSSCWSSMDKNSSKLLDALENHLQPSFRDRLLPGLPHPGSAVEFLSFFLSDFNVLVRSTVRKAAAQLLWNILNSDQDPQERNICLAYSFGSVAYGFGKSKATCSVWSDLPPDQHWSRSHLLSVRRALPLEQYNGTIHDYDPPQAPAERPDFLLCILRTVTRLLSPVWPWTEGQRALGRKEDNVVPVGAQSAGDVISDLDLCVRCLHAHLCSPRSVLRDADKASIVVEILENTVLARAQGTGDRALLWDIIGVVSHFIPSVLDNAVTKEEKSKATRLFGRFLRSTESREHDEGSQETAGDMSWDLEEYLRIGAYCQVSQLMDATERARVEDCVDKLKTLTNVIPVDHRDSWMPVRERLHRWPLP